jgi:hypothetical protein
MNTNDDRLEIAAFLDSAAARRVALPRDDQRRLAEAFLHAARRGVGKQPWELDGEDLVALLTEHLPARLGTRERAGLEALDVLEALLDHFEERHVVSHSFELRNALANHGAKFLETVASGRLAGRVTLAAQPFEHGAPKLGRNDPCSCGSGKKFKKCHGKDA